MRTRQLLRAVLPPTKARTRTHAPELSLLGVFELRKWGQSGVVRRGEGAVSINFYMHVGEKEGKKEGYAIDTQGSGRYGAETAEESGAGVDSRPPLGTRRA